MYIQYLYNVQYVNNCFYNILFYCTDATVSFEESTYRINENADDPLKPVLVISTLSSLDITIVVTDNSNAATGK